MFVRKENNMEEKKKCNCGPDCTCGCQEGKECTCDGSCECGCQEGKECTCEDKTTPNE